MDKTIICKHIFYILDAFMERIIPIFAPRVNTADVHNLINVGHKSFSLSLF